MSSDEFLNQIGVASPCRANWGEMSGNDKVRFCGLCRKHVYNISRISSDETLRLIQETEGQLCVRLFRRGDGTVISGDCPVGVQRVWSKWKRLVAVVSTSAVVGLAVRLAPSLQAGPPPARSTGGVPAAPGPVLVALQEFVATFRDWLGIEPDSSYGPEMGDMCLPPGWAPAGATGLVEDLDLPPASPVAIRHSDA